MNSATARDHLELGVFAPTIGRRPPLGEPSFFLIADVEQRTDITYAGNLRVAQLIDRAGLEFFFMAQRGGRGFGSSRFWSYGLDSFTVAAAIAQATERLRIASTVHTAFFHPAMVARMGATLDQISGGRWGLNLVSGWTESDFEMLGVPFLEHDARYAQTAEFAEILRKCWSEDRFDYRGEYFDMVGASIHPQPSAPLPLFNAGSSEAAKDFTARHCDWWFTGANTSEELRAQADEMRERAARYGREVRVLTYLYVLCRDSEKAANEEVAEILEGRDDEAATELIEGLMGQTLGTAAAIFGQGLTEEDILQNAIVGTGSGKLIGTPERVADRLAELQAAGLDGAIFTFRHFEEEMAAFIDKVLPILEAKGVRKAAAR